MIILLTSVVAIELLYIIRLLRKIKLKDDKLFEIHHRSELRQVRIRKLVEDNHHLKKALAKSGNYSMTGTTLN